MTEADLYTLYKLHEVDARIVEIKQVAAAFDPTRDLRLAYEKAKKAADQAKAELDHLRGDHKDLELKFKTVFDRLTKQMDAMMGGKVTNPREIEALERDVEDLRDRADRVEQSRVAVAEKIPQATELSDRLQAEADEKKKVFAAAYKEAVKTSEALQTEYKELVAHRGPLAEKVPPGLLAQYDAIRHKYGGIGMSIIREGKFCGGCGTLVPTKSVAGVQEGKLITCETCHRILYFAGSAH